MTWIDGEYFESPIEELYRRRDEVIDKTLKNALDASSNLAEQGDIVGAHVMASSGIMRCISMMAKPIIERR